MMQLCEADENELQDILRDVEMTKPYHVKRFKKALENRKVENRKYMICIRDHKSKTVITPKEFMR